MLIYQDIGPHLSGSFGDSGNVNRRGRPIWKKSIAGDRSLDPALFQYPSLSFFCFLAAIRGVAFAYAFGIMDP